MLGNKLIKILIAKRNRSIGELSSKYEGLENIRIKEKNG